MNLWETPTTCIINATNPLSKTFANYFAAKGYSLILTDIDRSKLKELAEQLRWEYQVPVNIAILDFTNHQNVENFTNHWLTDSPVEILINNTRNLVEQQVIQNNHPHRQHLIEIMQKNIELLLHTTLSEMGEKGTGTIVNIAAISDPTIPLSKTDDNRTFLTKLHKQYSKRVRELNITMQLLCPYPKENRLNPLSWEEIVVKESIRGLLQKTPIVKVTNSWSYNLISRLFPSKKRGSSRRPFVYR